MDAVHRTLHRFDYYNAVEVVRIIDAIDAPPRCVEVTTAGGRIVRLPSSQCQFMPGRVVIPVWLYDKIFTRARGDASEVPRPAGRSIPSRPR